MLMVLAFASIRFGHKEESIARTAVVHFGFVCGAVYLVENDEKYLFYKNKYIQILFEEFSLVTVDPTITEITIIVDNLNNIKFFQNLLYIYISNKYSKSDSEISTKIVSKIYWTGILEIRSVYWTAHGRIFERPTHYGRGYPRVYPADPGVDPISALLYVVIFFCFKNIYLTMANYNKLSKNTIYYILFKYIYLYIEYTVYFVDTTEILILKFI